jgi:hypothetical protein
MNSITAFFTDHRFCEFCGDVSASKVELSTSECTDFYYICNKCQNLPNLDASVGKTKYEVIRYVHKLFIPWFPLSCCMSKERNCEYKIILCNNCSRPVSELFIFKINKQLKSYKAIKNYMPHKFVYLNNDLNLCIICLKRVLINFVRDIDENNIPLNIYFNLFQESAPDKTIGINAKSIDLYVQDLIKKRIDNVRITTLSKLGEHKQPTSFYCSVEHLTPNDCKLLDTSCDNKVMPTEEEDYWFKANINPLIVGKYEHGYFIDISGITRNGDIKSLISHHYSNSLIKIITYASKVPHHFVIFDSTAPLYREFL